MSNSQQIIQASAMPTQQLPSYPPGANSPMTAGIIKQQQQAEMQNTRNKIGGAPVVQVPPVPSGSVSPDATANNYKNLTQLAQQQSAQSAYDTARTNSDTNAITSQQNAMYNGGKRRRTKKRHTKKRHRSRRHKSRRYRKRRR
jgi:hypothetical protein